MALGGSREIGEFFASDFLDKERWAAFNTIFAAATEKNRIEILLILVG